MAFASDKNCQWCPICVVFVESVGQQELPRRVVSVMEVGGVWGLGTKGEDTSSMSSMSKDSSLIKIKTREWVHL